MTELLVTQMRYTTANDETFVHIYGRTQGGKKAHVQLRGMEPYFYVRDNPSGVFPATHRYLVRKIEKATIGDLVNRPLWKIYPRFPFDTPELRRFFSYHYEADIPFVDRTRFDVGIKHQIRIPDNKSVVTKQDITSVDRTIYPEILYIDIETDDSRGFASPEEGASPVRSIALYCTQLKKMILLIEGELDNDKVQQDFKELYEKYFGAPSPPLVIQKAQDEYELFQKLSTLFKKLQPDIITGWNVEGYDITYLRARAEKRGYTRPSFKEYAIFDAQRGYEKLHKGRTYPPLEFASQEEFSVGKLKREKIHVMFENDKEKLAVYNLWDIVLTQKIDEKRDIIGFHLNLAWFAGCSIENTHGQEALVDKYMLHQTAGIVVVPSREMLHQSGVEKGAYVKEGQFGLFKNVCVIDFTSMYPYNVLSCNLSPETKLDHDPGDDSVFRLPSGRIYKKHPKGLVPIITEKLVKMRQGMQVEMKKYQKNTSEYKSLWEQQRAVKYFTNAVYGVLGSSIFRLADGDVGSDITHLGRELIKHTLEQVEKMGHNPLYADTDSVMFQAGENVEDAVKIGLEVTQILNQFYPMLARSWNGEKECMHEVKLEKVYKAWFQPGVKKRYVGLIDWDGDTEDKFIQHIPVKDRLDVKGFEIVRSNAALITKSTQRDTIRTALESDEYRDAIITYLRDLRHKFFEGKCDKLLTLPASWNKLEYKSKQAHIRAMEFSLTTGLIDIQPGEPFCWLYVHQVTGMPATDVAALEYGIEEIPKEVKIDYEKMWERNIKKPLNLVLQGLGITWEEIITGKRQESLDQWI